jgi:prepilin-type processing-associated H-X9-DG protein
MATEVKEAGVGGSEAPKQTRFPRRRAARWVGRVLIGTILGGLAWLFVWGAVLPGIEQARRENCRAQLKELGVAFHQYNEAHGTFPAPAISDRDGRPLLSWRVALLPHLGQESLYARFHRDEPWNSPNNLALLKEMPAVFGCPSSNASAEYRTSYCVIVGPKGELGSINTAFEPGRGVDIREFTDGTSNTVLVVEAIVAVPWTKPEELEYVPLMTETTADGGEASSTKTINSKAGPLPRFGSGHAEGFNVLMADGGARFIKATILEQTLRAILTRNGGEVLGSA